MPLFTPDEEEQLMEAREAEPAEPVALIAAYDLLLEKARPLSPDGWQLHAAELIPHARFLEQRVEAADHAAVTEIDSTSQASDEAIIAELGGSILHAHGRRLWQPDVIVDLLTRLRQWRELERDARLIVIGDGDEARIEFVPPEQ
jgi:hypothetical protein